MREDEPAGRREGGRRSGQSGGRPAEPPLGPSPVLVSALKAVLRPLARLLIRERLRFPLVSELLKEVYVEVAEREFPVGGKPQTDSRVTLLTGVHRKDVKRLRERSHGPDEDRDLARAAVGLGGELVARWTGDPAYLDAAGRPRPLPRLDRKEGGPSFEALVAGVSTDIRSRAVLDEWLRLGVVSVDDDDRVVLRTEAFIPAKGFEEKAAYLGRNVGDHLAAATHNLAGEGPAFLERSVHYDGISERSARILRDMAERLGMDALQALNRRAYQLAEAEKGKKDAARRINFGVYLFEENDPGPGPQAPDPTGADRERGPGHA